MVFAATFLINQNVAAYGDDYGYYTFTANGLDNFVAKHINHYMHDNGRFIVHVLVTIFLALPKAMRRIFNSQYPSKEKQGISGDRFYIKYCWNVYRVIVTVCFSALQPGE